MTVDIKLVVVDRDGKRHAGRMNITAVSRKAALNGAIREARKTFPGLRSVSADIIE